MSVVVVVVDWQLLLLHPTVVASLSVPNNVDPSFQSLHHSSVPLLSAPFSAVVVLSLSFVPLVVAVVAASTATVTPDVPPIRSFHSYIRHENVVVFHRV